MATLPRDQCVLEEMLRCVVCLDLYTDPVTLPCGHNFCRHCIRQYWSGSGNGATCPQCRETFRHQPSLKKNHSLDHIVEELRDPRRVGVGEWVGVEGGERVGVGVGEGVVETLPVCDSCPAPVRSQALVSCSVCLLSLCVLHAQQHRDSLVFRGHRLRDIRGGKGQTQTQTQKMNDLLKKIEEGIIERLSLLESLNRATETARLSVEEEKGGCIQALEQLEAGVATLREQLGSLIEKMEGEREKEAGEMRQRLKTEMEELRERGRKLKELQPGDSLQGVQSVSPPPVCQLVSVSLGAVTSALTSITTEFQRLCREELNAAIRPVRVFAFNPVKTALTGLDYVSMYATDVRVDPASAHPCLIVSPDGKSLRTGPRRQPLPPSPYRFDRVYCALAQRGFTKGCHYWEVEVGHKRLWRVGLFRGGISRQGPIPEEGYWVLEGERGQGLKLKGCQRRRGVGGEREGSGGGRGRGSGGVDCRWESLGRGERAEEEEEEGREGKGVTVTVLEGRGPLPSVVGVFLDRDGGTLEFYDSEMEGEPLARLEGCFQSGEPLFPLFCPGMKEDGEWMVIRG
ncbi:E3 ubiquitin-protein ligase TRIM39 isoform X2 [Amia ocellicauda]|uniref:E3 ubiquitin-protein ligase TRIM39 isoform X2 n=1 Tax=Amia ocellicauda TaxID=2972642 RepID=UPI0034642700